MNGLSNNIQSSSKSNKGLWVAIVVCIAIIIGTFYSAFSYLAFALAILAILALKQEDALALMMMVMPFANIFKPSPEAQSFFTYLMLIYVIWYFAKNRFVHKGFLLSLFALIVYLVVQMTVSMNILRTIKFVANLLFIYLAVNSANVHNNKKLYIAYIVGFVVTSLIAALNIIPNLTDYIGTQDFMIENQEVFRFTGMYGDPNYYSINVIISLCLIVILNHRKELSAVPAIGLAALMVLFVGLTMSKSAFLMLIFPLVLLLYSKIQKKNYLLFACVTVISAILVVQLLTGKIEIFSGVLNRFNEATDADSLTTGRSYLWERYMNFLGDNPFTLWFGGGFGANLLSARESHNTYIDMLYYLGILGTVLLATVFGVLSKFKRKSIKLNLLNYSVWLCIAVMYFFLSQLFYFDWAFHIVIAILVSKMDMNQMKEAYSSEKI